MTDPKHLHSWRAFLTLTGPGVLGLTMAVKLHNDVPSLGGRERIHFAMRCLKIAVNGVRA
jgi:hypothetical protein